VKASSYLHPDNGRSCEGLTFKIEAGVKQGRRHFVLAGLGGGAVVGVAESCIGNAVLAVSHRVLRYYDKKTGDLRPVIKPEHGAWNKAIPFITSLAGLVRRTCPKHLTMQEFVDSSPPHLKRRYGEAMEAYLTRGMTSRDAMVKVFVKYEKLVEKNGKMPIPRMISPRSPVFNMRLGMFLRPIEHSIYAGIAVMFAERFGSVEPPVTKGQDLRRKARGLANRWQRFPNPVALSLDGEKWDQHVSASALKVEHLLYKLIYQFDRELAWLLEQQIKNRCSGNFPDGWLKYVVEGSRMSGDVNTSLGNCTLSCLLIYLYLCEQGVAKAEIANDGDDLLVIVERKELKRFDSVKEWYKEMGFSMTVEAPVYHLEQCDFCSSHPVQLNRAGEWIMVRKLAALSKDVVSLSAVNLKEARNWMAATGECGLIAASGIPMYSALHRKLLAVGNPRKAPNRKLLENTLLWSGAMGEVVVEEDVVRSSFHLATGLTPELQIAYEENIAKAYEVQGACESMPPSIYL
jgi:hypothetical protein